MVCGVGGDQEGATQMASGKLEISCVRVEQEQPQQMWSILEADAAEFLVDLGKTAFGYGLQNGTIGVYRHTTRLWRVKSKHRLCSLTALDVYADGHVRFISGWSNGKVVDRLSGREGRQTVRCFEKVEVRKALTGEMLFRECISTAVAAILAADLRNVGTPDIVICGTEGNAKGFQSVSTLPPSKKIVQNIALKEKTLARLNQRAKVGYSRVHG